MIASTSFLAKHDFTFEAHGPLGQRRVEVDAPTLQVDAVGGGVGDEAHARLAEVGHDGGVPLGRGVRLQGPCPPRRERPLRERRSVVAAQVDRGTVAIDLCKMWLVF